MMKRLLSILCVIALSCHGGWLWRNGSNECNQDVNFTGTTVERTGDFGVTGDITVTGTVDGRDPSADGAVLDGIDSGAEIKALYEAEADTNAFTDAEKSRLAGVAEGADVTADNPPQAHASSHQSGGGDAIKLDDLASPDDNTDLNASTSAHGLLLKLSGNASDVLHGDGTWGQISNSISALDASDGDPADCVLVGADGNVTVAYLITHTQIPTGNTATTCSVAINPASAVSNADLLWLGINGTECFTVDEDGDVGMGTDRTIYFTGGTNQVGLAGGVGGRLKLCERNEASDGQWELFTTQSTYSGVPPPCLLMGAKGKTGYDGGSVYLYAGDHGSGASSEGSVVIMCADGTTKLLEVSETGAWRGFERSVDPDEPAEGEFVVWMSDGTGKGDDGDVCIASKAGGTTKWAVLFDHSAGSAW